MGIRDMVRRIEESVVQWLDFIGVSAYGKPSAPGVYVTTAGVEAKIAALGLKVRNGCTYHGLAVNIAMDLAPFADIDPCGFPGLRVTQLADLGIARTLEAAGNELAPILAGHLTRR
jgi:lipoyl(octanoyl) transferase